MRKPSLPHNPNTGSPERKATITRRLGMVVGGLATTAFCAMETFSHNQQEVKGNWMMLGLFAVGFTVIPVVNEITERRSDGPGNGGWNKGWEPPEEPFDPGPSGLRADFLDEIDAYLVDQTAAQTTKDLVSV